MTTAEKTASLHRRRRERRRAFYRHSAVIAGAAVVSAALAFFAVPTGQLSSRNLVQINGITYTLPAGPKVSELAQLSALLARPGSSLDLTGDVVALGAGAPATRLLNGGPLDEDLVLADGAQISVQHGAHVLEGIKRITKDIPFETTVTGKGAIVSLVTAGTPGLREIYKGVSSSKQAAALVVTAPREAVLERSTTVKPGQKLAALTFDDGPGKYTQKVLDALAAEHVPATFFVIGSSAAGNKAMIAKIKAAGHEVENHTWSHPDLTKVSAGEFQRQVSLTNAVIGGSRFLRPPYANSDATVRARAAAMGLRLAFWTVDTRDWQYPDVGSIMSYVKAQTQPDAIILMHDGGNDRSATVAAIPVVVDWLFEHGYSLTTVDYIL